MFERVYSRHQAKRVKVHPLYVLIGMANLRGQTAILYFNYRSRFSPLFLRGVNAVGSLPACNRFHETLDRTVAESLQSGRSWPLEIDVWAMVVATALKLGAIDEGNDATVGGLVQLLVVDRSGSREVDVSSTAGDPMDAASWDEVTVGHDALKRYHPLFRVPYLASGEPDLSLHHISD